MSQALLDRPRSTTERATASPSIPGVSTLGPDQARFQRRVTLVVTILPFLGFLIAVATMWGGALSALDLGIMVGTYLFTGIGITVGFHRLFTHRSFKAKPALRAGMAIAGSMAVEGPVLKWVADHRRHHAYADQEGDPHSPHLDEGPGLRGVLKGLWHAHIGWFFDDEKTSIRRWAPDLAKEPVMRRIDRLFPLWVAISFAAPAVIGLVVTQSMAGAASAFLWGSLVRIFLLHHVTWSVNSICHFYGRRAFETSDYSTNNWPLALISFGESWHNNHHAFPTSARHGLRRGQIDPGGFVIKLFEKVGLAYDVKRLPEAKLLSKAAVPTTRPG